jgi:hypothetical protein
MKLEGRQETRYLNCPRCGCERAFDLITDLSTEQLYEDLQKVCRGIGIMNGSIKIEDDIQ